MYKEISYKRVFLKLEAGKEVYCVDFQKCSTTLMSYMTVGEITGILSDDQKHRKYYIYEIEKPA